MAELELAAAHLPPRSRPLMLSLSPPTAPPPPPADLIWQFPCTYSSDCRLTECNEWNYRRQGLSQLHSSDHLQQGLSQWRGRARAREWTNSTIIIMGTISCKRTRHDTAVDCGHHGIQWRGTGWRGTGAPDQSCIVAFLLQAFDLQCTLGCPRGLAPHHAWPAFWLGSIVWTWNETGPAAGQLRLPYQKTTNIWRQSKYVITIYVHPFHKSRRLGPKIFDHITFPSRFS
jgi:hypothetical protein